MSNEWSQGYAEHLSELAKQVGGKVEVNAGVWQVIHKDSGQIAYTSTSPRNVAGWLAGQRDSGQPIQAPPPRRGRKPGAAKKSARKAAKKSARKAATKTGE
jgi:hypothetical protein